MSKILVIGAAGLIGKDVVKELGEGNCIRASRSSDERVDISDPKSLAALFGRVGELDGIICTGGAARFKPWDQLTDEDWTFSLANKLLGQINVVRYGLKSVQPGGAITLTTGLASQYPAPGSSIITTVNSAIDAFVCAVAADPSISIRVNTVSPGWVSETLQAMGRNPSPRSLFGNFARAQRGRWRRPQRSKTPAGARLSPLWRLSRPRSAMRQGGARRSARLRR